MKNVSRKIAIVIVLIMMLIVNVSKVEAQPQHKNYLGMDYARWLVFIPGNDSVKPFYISARPVTNREYILFMVWTQFVYGNDYPEVLLDIMPGITDTIRSNMEFRPFADSSSFNFYMKYGESFVSDYIFNPEYTDFPVIGLKWEQANKFSHWLSDRYNEYSLIKAKYLAEDPNQADESNFSTESFIFSQYEGVIRKFWNIISEDSTKNGFNKVSYLIRPSFHVATGKELITANNYASKLSVKKLYDKFDQYSTEGMEFLSVFYKYFLRSRKGYIYVYNYNYEMVPYYLESLNPKPVKLPASAVEWCLDSYAWRGRNSVNEVYTDYGYHEDDFALRKLDAEQKDSLGIMKYIITGEDNSGKIEMVYGSPHMKKAARSENCYVYDDATGKVILDNGSIFKTFRIAVNAVKKPVKK